MLDGSWGTGQTGSSSFEEWIIERKAFSWRLLEHWEFILRVAIHPGTRIEIQWLDQIAAQRGMSFWYWNQLASYITVECIEDMNVECVNTSSTTTTSGSGSSCSAYCNGGPDDGQCCDKDSTTTTGSCTTLGQEGCCGGTSDTTYCQLADDPGPTTKKPKPKYRRRKHYRKHHRRRY